MKKKIISIILIILMLGLIIFVGMFYSSEISKMMDEYRETGLDDLLLIVDTYYVAMYSYIIYIIVFFGLLMKIDSLYISKYSKINTGKTFYYWSITGLIYTLLLVFSQLLRLDVHLFSSIGLVVYFAYISIDNLVLSSSFLEKT